MGSGVHFSEEEKMSKSISICKMIERDEFTLASVCESHNIDVRTFYNWRKANSEISDIYKAACGVQDAIYIDRLVGKARTALEKKLEEQEYTEVHTTAEIVYDELTGRMKLDESGKPMRKIKEVKQVKKVRQPETTAIIFFLTNKDRLNFKRNPDLVDESGQGDNLTDSNNEAHLDQMIEDALRDQALREQAEREGQK